MPDSPDDPMLPPASAAAATLSDAHPFPAETDPCWRVVMTVYVLTALFAPVMALQFTAKRAVEASSLECLQARGRAGLRGRCDAGSCGRCRLGVDGRRTAAAEHHEDGCKGDAESQDVRHL